MLKCALCVVCDCCMCGSWWVCDKEIHGHDLLMFKRMRSEGSNSWKPTYLRLAGTYLFLESKSWWSYDITHMLQISSLFYWIMCHNNTICLFVTRMFNSQGLEKIVATSLLVLSWKVDSSLKTFKNLEPKVLWILNFFKNMELVVSILQSFKKLQLDVLWF